MEKIKIDLLPNEYRTEEGLFKKEEALNICGKIAGVCYNKEGFNALINEDKTKTDRRIDLTLNNGHHSVYDHIYISLNIQNIPKILAMIINNEHEYTTSEKSARYTKIVKNEDSIISDIEIDLYNKWNEILYVKIKDKYENFYNDAKIKKLAQENARYFVTVFMPTQMIYTTSLRQINYIVSWLEEYKKTCNKTEFNNKLINSIDEFINELKRLNILCDGLLKNEKHRTISLFNSNISKKEEYYGDIYLTKYDTSFACVAQAQRHRTLDYEIQINEDKKYFVPPIIEDDEVLVSEWINDMNKVKNITPQGELVSVVESGKYEDFILKCKERLCTSAQLEIMLQTKKTLEKYKNELEAKNHYLKDDIKNYTHGARCTFKTFKCSEDCKFKEGKILTRKI